MESTNEELNKIAKSMNILLPTVDKEVSWVDFLPISSGLKLIAVGYKKGAVKYADVSGLCPFDAASHVVGCMEDANFDKQFLWGKKLEAVRPLVSDFAKEAAYKKDVIIRQTEGFAKKGEVKKVLERCEKSGVFSPLVRKHVNKENLPSFFKKCVESTTLTSYDLFLLYDAVFS